MVVVNHSSTIWFGLSSCNCPLIKHFLHWFYLGCQLHIISLQFGWHFCVCVQNETTSFSTKPLIYSLWICLVPKFEDYKLPLLWDNEKWKQTLFTVLKSYNGATISAMINSYFVPYWNNAGIEIGFCIRKLHRLKNLWRSL